MHQEIVAHLICTTGRVMDRKLKIYMAPRDGLEPQISCLEIVSDPIIPLLRRLNFL